MVSVSSSTIHIDKIQGIDETDVPALQQKFGKNVFHDEGSRRFVHIIWDIVKDPMFILLVIACSLYFILNKTNEGFMMIVAMLFVGGISVYQEARSTKALQALKEFTEPKVIVIRSGKEKTIAIGDVVPGDVVVLIEGNKVPADAIIIKQHDLSIDESIITGESFPVEKNEKEGNNVIYQGTTINSGQCYATVTAIGNNTVLGKLGKAASGYSSPKTLLQLQIGRFVKRLALFGFAAFLLIFFFNFIKSQNAISSLLFSLTLAMAVIPEEIPVAFSSFMALGAWHMAKLGIISRQPQTIENLGAVSVICLDKTGTITENIMQVKLLYDYKSGHLINLDEVEKIIDGRVLRYGVLASEINPFDSMEKAIHSAYEKYSEDRSHQSLKMIYEYPLEGKPPMMTHVYQHENSKIIAAKGAAERILKICSLNSDETKKLTAIITSIAQKGYRVIGVASAEHVDGSLPAAQDDFNWKFEGLLALYDPPRKNMAFVFKKFYDARIKVKLITGDFAETAITVAQQIGMTDHIEYYLGDDVMKMNETDLREAVKTVNLFARMFPEAKLKVIEALKANGEIVAMTGDGVNDAPALRSSHIGIAMGEKGTEIARQAADLILTKDDLSKMIEAIRQGRKIFNNLKKAIRYIISIHIPIILTASLPLLLGWKYPNIFTPIHIIFLEIIMGPTCSIFFEREPVEDEIMLRYPRDRKEGLFRKSELLISIIQGCIIAAGILILYWFYMNNGHSLELTRTIVFTSLIIANVFLTFANRSFSKTFATTVRYKNNLVLPVTIISALFLLGFLLIPVIRNLFELSSISSNDFLVCLFTAFVCVSWFELYKLLFKKKS